jgi:transmembrane sensor
MNQNHFWNLLAKKLSGEASPEEMEELERLFKAHPELTFPAQHIADLWAVKKQDEDGEAEEAFQKHLQKLQGLQDNAAAGQKQRKGPKRLSLIMAFVAVVTSIAVGWFLFTGNSKTVKPLAQKAEIYTLKGVRTKLVLPDSSVVWLNAGSKLTYDPDFGSSNRATTLTGEAYFDVKKSSLPFLIQANGVRIRVLGTAFNVKAYPNEQTTETTLIRGRVEVMLDKRPGESIVLKPNEKLVVSNRLPDEKKKSADALPVAVIKELTRLNDSLVAETSWVENKLVFQDESLEEVARKMERWYNVSIEIKDEKLAQMHVGGGPFENESIEQALTALQIAFNFSFTKKGKYITITR